MGDVRFQWIDDNFCAGLTGWGRSHLVSSHLLTTESGDDSDDCLALLGQVLSSASAVTTSPTAPVDPPAAADPNVNSTQLSSRPGLSPRLAPESRKPAMAVGMVRRTNFEPLLGLV